MPFAKFDVEPSKVPHRNKWTSHLGVWIIPEGDSPKLPPGWVWSATRERVAVRNMVADRVAHKFMGQWTSPMGIGLYDFVRRIGVPCTELQVFQFADGSAVLMDGDYWDTGMVHGFGTHAEWVPDNSLEVEVDHD